MKLRHVAIGVVLVLILSLVFIAWRSSRRFESKAVRLADGSFRRVASMSYGRDHRFFDSPPWKRNFAKILPTNIVSLLGIKMLRQQTTNDSLMIWIERGNYTNAGVPISFLATCDGLGLEAFPEAPTASLQRTDGSGVMGFLLKSFPRSDPVLRLRLKEYTGPMRIETVAEFELRNKWVVKIPPWKAGPLPQTKRDGDFEFTLLALNTGLTVTGTGTLHQHYQLIGTWTEAVFQIGTNEPARFGTNAYIGGDWIFGKMKLTDPTGNEVDMREPQPRIVQQTEKQYWARQDDGVANLYGAVWPDEVWKLRAEFRQTYGAKLPDNQLWTLNNIPIPAPGETINFHTNEHVFGTEIVLISFAGKKPEDKGPKLHVHFVRPDGRYELRVRASDQRGTNFIGVQDFVPRSTNFVFEFHPPQGAKMANLTFGVTRSYTAEFLVQPALSRTNLDHWPTR